MDGSLGCINASQYWRGLIIEQTPTPPADEIMPRGFHLSNNDTVARRERNRSVIIQVVDFAKPA